MRPRQDFAAALTHFLSERQGGKSQCHDKRQGKQNYVHGANMCQKTDNCNNWVTAMFRACAIWQSALFPAQHTNSCVKEISTFGVFVMSGFECLLINL